MKNKIICVFLIIFLSLITFAGAQDEGMTPKEKAAWFGAQGKIRQAREELLRDSNIKQDILYYGLLKACQSFDAGKISRLSVSFLSRAIDYSNSGNLDAALDQINKVVSSNPNLGEVYLVLGGLQNSQGNLSDAQSSFRKAKELFKKTGDKEAAEVAKALLPGEEDGAGDE